MTRDTKHRTIMAHRQASRQAYEDALVHCRGVYRCPHAFGRVARSSSAEQTEKGSYRYNIGPLHSHSFRLSLLAMFVTQKDKITVFGLAGFEPGRTRSFRFLRLCLSASLCTYRAAKLKPCRYRGRWSKIRSKV